METKQFSALISYVESQLGYLQFKYDKMEKQLAEDFTYYLSWNAEEMFTLGIRLKELKVWRDRLEEMTEEVFFVTQIEAYQNFLSSTSNVIGSSTNQAANLCVSWKYKTILGLTHALESLRK